VPLALTIIAPVIVNILLFHAFMAPSGLPVAVFVVLLWTVVAYPVRSTFFRLFEHNTGSAGVNRGQHAVLHA
jgi:hypothetical protein